MLYTMDRRAGFTLIEVLITISIMTILLTLAVISLRANQATARDDERSGDVTVIAQQLESYYKSGSSPIATYPPGEYPPTDLMNTEANIRIALRDLDTKALRAPGVATTSPISFTVATNTTEPSPDTNTYVYMPLTRTGTLCQTAAQECYKFTLYYKLENNAAVQKIMSKNQ
jgi:prepilin-type N-terminal cleavage/methylation domain-containing protein